MTDVIGVADPRTVRHLRRGRLLRLRLLLLLLLWRRGRWRCCIVRRRWRRRAPALLFRHPVGLKVRPHLLILRGARLSGARRSLTAKRFAALRSVGIPRLRRRVDIGNPTTPGVRAGTWSAAIEHRLLRLRRTRAGPLRSGGSHCASGLIRLRMNVGRHRRLSRRSTICLSVPEQLEAGFDVRIVRVKFGSARVGVEGIGDLVVARFVLMDFAS